MEKKYNYRKIISSFIAPELIKLFKRKRNKKTEYQLLKHTPRYIKTEVTLLEKKINIPDSASFVFMYNEIFEEEIYKFNTISETPYFIDGGANIGLASIYLKNRFPKAKILAFEPDSYIYSFLRNNIDKFDFSNIEMINKGLWNVNTKLEFMSEGADGGILTDLTEDKKTSFEVEVVKLQKRIDDFKQSKSRNLIETILRKLKKKLFR